MAKSDRERQPATPSFGRKVYYVLRASALVLALLAINRFLVPKRHLDVYYDLDDFQQMNSFSPVVEDSIAKYGTDAFHVPAPEERAVVTILYSEAYATGAMALGHSLRAANVSARRIILYYPDALIDRTMCYLQATGWELRPLPRRQSNVDRYLELRLWTLDEIGIKSVVYLEADTLALRNLDELWSLPFRLAAVPVVHGDARRHPSAFSSSMMLLRTSTALFEDMLRKIEPPCDMHDEPIQDFLNKYFAAQVVKLPYLYNADIIIKKRSPMLWSAITEDMRTVRYSFAKPFREQQRRRAVKDIWETEMGWWESAWLDTFKEMAYKC